MVRQISVAIAFLALIACSTSCATSGRFPESRVLNEPPAHVGSSLFLIGDAGKGKEPVLRALTAELDKVPDGSAVVFLGDNVYPSGFAVDAPGGDSAGSTERDKLQKQISAVIESRSGRAIFVPGNHDWDQGGRHGLESIQAQAAYVERLGKLHHDRVEFAPEAGCPGPHVVDLSTRLRVIALDTQWWLHTHERETSSCFPSDVDLEKEFRARLEQALVSAEGRHVVLVAHHPMLSTGSHGGHYSWKNWYKGLVRLGHWLNLDKQDLSGHDYTKLRRRVKEVVKDHSPLLYAAGHEHTQEILRGDSTRYFVVSGSGSYGQITPTGVRKGKTIFKNAASGFMRLDILDDGRPWLTVLEVDESGNATQVFSDELR